MFLLHSGEGLRHCEGETLILDGDLLYPPQALTDYVKNAPRSSFALIPADIEDAECAKVLLNPSGTIHAFITKRALTKDERSVFVFGGEASPPNTKTDRSSLVNARLVMKA